MYISDSFIAPFAPGQTVIPDMPLIPQQTVLDRAFYLQYIPGCEHQELGAEKLSSVARFDALFR
jgi:hypothetical protein